eukprot:2795449-Amphidinium_carterae.1
MSAVTDFDINGNSFEGALPERGFQAMRGVLNFLIYGNSFKGRLPESGIRTMSAMACFCMQ